ncbi:MAG: nicotinate phosphoribosyltransferase [Crocinitomicaceae bacterium]|nr:nicotinate phosphoribosyltransferase [Crocinitomicaceae bacterium]
MLSTLLTDFYKIGHINQYPAGTQKVYSNLTARKSRNQDIDKVVFFGLQYFMKKYLVEDFKTNFFSRPLDEVMDEYKRMCQHTIGDLPSYDHIADLHKLGYLPLSIKALPEGSKVPIGVPMLTIENTDDRFFWLTNFIESLMSAIIWQPITCATLANEYRKLFNNYLMESIGSTDFVPFMGHDFSFRGMGGLESACLTGMGHLTSFSGTDTIPAIMCLEKYYNANIENELVGCSVPATEHSVMSSGSAIEGEFETFKRLITDIYKSGIVSIVSDTFDLWEVLTDFLPRLKNEINAREGKVVIRPDSGDPVDIICGTYQPHHGDYESRSEPEEKGVVELLWEAFGGTEVNGYKVLNDKVGAIYGDSITTDRADQISKRLMAKGFAPLIVYGIGSYTYQYNTRDTFGMAVKCTAIVNNNKEVEVYKDPITDDGTKKSLKGFLIVEGENGNYTVRDGVTREESMAGSLNPVFLDGQLINETNLSAVRRRVAE